MTSTTPMLSLSHDRQGLPAKFKPEEAGKREAQADVVIAYAKRVRDWPMLDAAIAQKIEDQAQFVAWWSEAVQPANRPRKITVSDRTQLSVDAAETMTGITKRQVSRWRQRLQQPETYRALLYGAAWSKAMAEEADKNIAAKWTGDPEWYTPPVYIEAARSVMGAIDLDPASNHIAQRTVKATRWFSEEEDGLSQPWEGRVFLNPPYAFPTVAHFVEKLCAEFQAGRVMAAVLLTNNNTDTGWWHQAAKTARAVCFTAGRISFYKADGGQRQPTNGQTFFYFGSAMAAFELVFSEFGLIGEIRRLT